MSTQPRAVADLFLAAALSLAMLQALPARAQSSGSSPDSLRKRRVELFVLAGQQPLKEIAGSLFQLASDSEHCRIAHGSKTCGLPSEPLKAGELEQVFDYYVRQPTNSAVDRQSPSVHKEDWNWNPDPRERGHSGDRRR